MNIDEAKQYILNHSKDYFQPAGRKGYVCPFCDSGKGKHGTGITAWDGVHFTCWAKNCFKNADVFQIYGQQHGTSDFMEQLKGLCSYYGISLDRETTKRADYKRTSKPELKEPIKPVRKETDYTKFFKEANAHLQDTNYHRGISTETLNRFNVGYVQGWTSPTAEKKVPSDRLIIPTSKYSYIARATGNIDKAYKALKVGEARLFNAEALTNSTQPVFIVEGEIDALSIIDLGFNAVGIGGTSGVTLFLQEVQEKLPSQPLIIALDNDEAGETATKQIASKKGPISAFMHFAPVSTLYGKEKDANGALQANRDAFKAVLEAEAIHAAREQERLQNELKEAYRQENSVFAYMDSFYKQLLEKPAKPTPTGFKCVDELLGGGLYAGLYIVGAISSLGKTTFCLQIADQLAKAGQDVLIFSLEMAKRELIAKSVSRLTYQETLATGETSLYASSTRSVLNGFNGLEGKRADFLKIGLGKYYGEYATRIFITEGMGNVGVDEIRKKVAEFVQIYKKAPIVVVDYLQILAPADVKATDKQNIDKAVLELKRLSRDFNTPILCVSSFNRENYKTPVNLASFKESGAIEYSSDVLLGLQYEGMDYQAGEGYKNPNYLKRVTNEVERPNEERASKGQPVRIEIKVLKNRNGKKGKTVLQFVPMFNCFTEEKQTDETPEAPETYDLYD